MPAYKPLRERFWEKVRYNPQSGCMEWTGSTIRRGYGMIGGERGTQNRLATHVRYELETGLTVPKGFCVCHRCDNPRCVTFAHFFIGTLADNNRDKMNKGRQKNLRGSATSNAKLTEEQVREIRRRYIPAHPIHGGYAMAREFRVTPPAIHFIVKRVSWRHVD